MSGGPPACLRGAANERRRQQGREGVNVVRGEIDLHTVRRYLQALRTGVRRPVELTRRMAGYFCAYRSFRSQESRLRHVGAKTLPLWPVLWDSTELSGDFGKYCYQDSWAFRHVLSERPLELVDVGSSVYFVAFAAQIGHVLSIDIRELRAALPSITYRRGDITSLPFGDGTIAAISTLSVIEHVGLGRYGDPIDPAGMRKAADQLRRVLRPGGMLLVAFPVADENLVVFNAHRVCTPETATHLFSGLELVDEKYALDDRIVCRAEYDRLGRPYSYGCYRFTKPA